MDLQLGGDLGAVDDEGFLELVLQLEQFPDRGVDDAVDQPGGLAAATQGIQGGQADGPGPAGVGFEPT